jgi:putative ABC transport system permease protein
VVISVAITVILVSGSLSMGRSLLKLLGTDLGFRTSQVVTLYVSLAGTRQETDSFAREYYREAVDRLRAVPGVESAGAVNYLPLVSRMGVAAHPLLEPDQEGPTALVVAASAGYFRAMGSQVIAGREFTAADGKGSRPVVIVDEALARHFGTTQLIDRRMKLSSGAKDWATVVGVVQTQLGSGPSYRGFPHVFVPVDQSPPRFLSLVARVRGNPEDYLVMCREAVQQVDAQIPVHDVKTLDQRLSENLARPRFYTTAILFFGGFALLLAVTGVYGVAAYSITQRTHEIGVCIAVGASPRRLRLQLLRQGLLPVVLGLATGVAGAVATGRFLKHMITPAEPVGAGTCGASALLLVVVAAVAVWTATGRILRIDPMRALRAE